jgi:hypothetical protein
MHVKMGVLFQGVHAELPTCPKCGLAWYKNLSQSSKLIKVLRHFLLIPRLKCMFRAHVMSEFMVWHAKNKSSDHGLVRHALDSKVWAHINASWPDFASEPHNVR